MPPKKGDKAKAVDAEPVAGDKRPADVAEEEGTSKKVAADAKLTVNGGCHCGKVKYTANIKPDAESGKFKASRCNCTFCQKLSHTNMRLDDPEDFKLLQPASKDELGDYASSSDSVNGHRYFCTTCGTQIWSQGWYQFGDAKYDFFNVNAASIDQPQDGFDLSEVKLSYWNGLNNDWMSGMKEVPFSGGLT